MESIKGKKNHQFSEITVTYITSSPDRTIVVMAVSIYPSKPLGKGAPIAWDTVSQTYENLRETEPVFDLSAL